MYKYEFYFSVKTLFGIERMFDTSACKLTYNDVINTVNELRGYCNAFDFEFFRVNDDNSRTLAYEFE